MIDRIAMFENALVARLEASKELGALIERRIFPIALPGELVDRVGADLPPCVVYRLTGRVDEQDLRDAVLPRVRYQIAVIATRKAAAMPVALLLEALLYPFSGGAIGEVPVHHVTIVDQRHQINREVQAVEIVTEFEFQLEFIRPEGE